MKLYRENSKFIIAFCPKHKDENNANFVINKCWHNGKPKGYAYCFACGHHTEYSSEFVDNLSCKETQESIKQTPIDWKYLQQQYVNNLNSKFGMELYLTNGDYTIVDTEDYNVLSKQSWRIMYEEHTAYVRRCSNNPPEIQMHRLILGLDNNDPIKTDHKNGDGLDNRKCNLRLCTVEQNIHNRKANKDSSSKYKGVWLNSLYPHRSPNKWKAGIRPYNDKQIHLGYFDNEVEAAKTYDNKAKELWGVFAKLNFPETSEYRLKDLSVDLGISVKTLRDFGIGYNNVFTFPMKDEQGRVIGVQYRNEEGKKWCVENSKLGLFYGTISLDKSVIICEGNTDAAVATDLGMFGIGRPSAQVGNSLVLDFLKLNRVKDVTIVADNDQSGIGLKSATKLSELFEQKGINRRIYIPEGVKDLREYYKTNGREETIKFLGGN